MREHEREHLSGKGHRALAPESLMMSYGYRPEWSEGALKSPIFQTSTFVFRTAEEGKAFFEVAYGMRQQGPDETLGLIYSRLNNPDLEILEDRLTLWDDAEAGAVFVSGMAAIATTLLAFARPGSVIVHSAPIYGGTDYLLNHVLPEFGVQPVAFHAGQGREDMEAAFERARDIGPVAAVLVETPANPTNALVDIAACAALTHAAPGVGDEKPPLIVDNTFLGPVFQHPLEHGADLVLYSATKFLGGHSDVIAGACLGNTVLLDRVRALRTFMGTMAGSWTGWLLLRSLETLKLRMTKQMENARHVAGFLREHPKVAAVHYLDALEPDDPERAVYDLQCKGPGSLIAFEVVGGEPEAFRVLNALELIKLAVSLGGTESLAEHPGSMTHSDVSPERQLEYGITPGMIRVSIGVEDAGDIVADLEQALEHV